MKNNKILKGAGVLLIAVLMISSVITVSADTIDKLEIDKLENDDKYVSYSSSQNMNVGSSLFLQLPHAPDEGWSAATSCLDPGYPIDYVVYENFWEITEEICDIHWWGLSLFFTGSAWVQCDPTGMTFNITFYQDVGGMPGPAVCSYDPVSPTITDTGDLYHSTIQAHLYLFETDLDPCCSLSTGWVSIQSHVTANNCWFMWISAKTGDGDSLQDLDDGAGPTSTGYDRAIELTGEEPVIPDLDCDGSLNWVDVKPGDTVTGDFVVMNIGDPGSLLNWEITDWPTWGNWTFTPLSGTGLKPGDGPFTVQVEVVAPDEQNQQFSGAVNIVNKDDATDTCRISVSLATPISHQVNNFPLLQRVLELFPNAFPILRNLLGM